MSEVGLVEIGPFPQPPRAPYPREAWAKYQALEMRPLRIEAHLTTPYVSRESGGAIHLDALLSWGWMQSWPVPLGYGKGACVTPLPLALLEVVNGPMGERLPVWASSDLLPQGDVLRDTEWWHKRYPTEHADWGKKLTANTTTGRYKEYRVPLPAIHTPVLVGICVGHLESIRELLELVTHVGQKSVNYGRVARWDVAPLEEDLGTTLLTIRKARPIPALDGMGARGGFTPPYWYYPWHTALGTR